MRPLLQAVNLAVLARAPIAPVALGIALGIIFDHAAPMPAAVYLLLAVTPGLAMAHPRWRRAAGAGLVLLTAIGAGGLLHVSAARTMPTDSVARYADETQPLVRLHGTVITPPRVKPPTPQPFAPWSYGSEQTIFLADINGIEGRDRMLNASGVIRVSVGEAVLDLVEGERVTLFGKLTPLEPPTNPGAYDWAAHFRRKGVVARLFCAYRESVQRNGKEKSVGILVHALRRTVRGWLTDDLITAGHTDQAGLLETMVLGHRSALDRKLNEIWVRAGCIHFLAASGVHLVIVMFFARMLARLLRAPPAWQTLTMAVAVIAYMVLAEPRPPILRAGIIALLYCGALLLHRGRARLNWIAAAGVILVVINPVALFGVGFQLSFAAVLGVSYLSPAIIESVRRLRGVSDPLSAFGADLQPPQEAPWLERWALMLRTRIRRAVAALATPFAVSVAAWLATWPIVATHFHRIQPWGPVNSVLVFPLVSISMLLGFVKIIVAAIAPNLAVRFGTLLAHVDGWLLMVVEWLSQLPGATIYLTPPPPWVTVSFYLALILFVVRFRTGPAFAAKPTKQEAARQSLARRRLTFALAGAGFAAVATLPLWTWSRTGDDALRVTVLDVGAGLATIIELPDGDTILCDAGSNVPYDIGRSVIVPFLRSRGIETIDRVYLSHPNLDHFSGLPTVMRELDVGPILVNRYFAERSADHSPGAHLLDLIPHGDHKLRTLNDAREDWHDGGVRFETLWPPDDMREEEPVNDTSTVLRLTYRDKSILLPGDVEAGGIVGLRLQGDLDADVLVLPHHGSVEPNTEALLQSVDPDLLVRSTHQTMRETFSELPAIAGDRVLLSTADHGAIQVTIDKDGLRWSTVKTQQ